MKGNYENLVLLEIMINEIRFFDGESILNRRFLSNLGKTCVQITFGNSKLLEIHEDERCERSINTESGTVTLKFMSGKSCLFSINKLKNSSAQGCYDVCISVMRKLPDGDANEHYTYGEASVNFKSIFKSLAKVRKCGQAAKSLKGVYDLKNCRFDTEACEKVGSLDMFVRGMSLGTAVITKFHLGSEDNAFYFKGTDEIPDEDDDEDDSSEALVKQNPEFSPLKQPGGDFSSPVLPCTPQISPNMPFGNVPRGTMSFMNLPYSGMPYNVPFTMPYGNRPISNMPMNNMPITNMPYNNVPCNSVMPYNPSTPYNFNRTPRYSLPWRRTVDTACRKDKSAACKAFAPTKKIRGGTRQVNGKDNAHLFIISNAGLAATDHNRQQQVWKMPPANWGGQQQQLPVRPC